MDLFRFTPSEPLKIGNDEVSHLVLKPLDAGGAIDAAQAAERVVFTPNGEPALVPSSVIATAERARRQVRTLVMTSGKEMSGPMHLTDLRRLSEPDLLSLYDRVEKIETLSLEKENDGGRSGDADGGGSAVGVADEEGGTGIPDGPGADPGNPQD